MCIEEEKMEYGKIFVRLIKEEKVEECFKSFCNGFEELLNVDEEESNVELDENISKGDCVINEYCKEINFYIKEEMRSGNEIFSFVSVNVV